MRAWDEFLQGLERELGRQTVDRWLRPLKVLRFDAANLYLQASDSFQLSWFEEQVRARVDSDFVNQNQRPIRVHLELPTPVEKRNRTRPLTAPAFELTFDTLDEQFTLDHYAPTSNNELTYQLLASLGKGERVDPGAFNPIYIHGGPGSGKTHLLMATAQACLLRGVHALYTRAETFTDHVVRAIRAGEMQMFRKAYRNVDLLLIDNVQVLARKGATQEELFHTFNTLHLSGRQLIFAADCPPSELRSVEPRLVSRFEWGINLQLHAPDDSEMRTILQKRAERMALDLSAELADYLLSTFGRTLTGAMRALEALVLRAHLDNDTLSIESAQKHLADLIQEEVATSLTPTRIVESVAAHYGIQPSDILGKSQRKECALPRKVAMHLCRSRLALSFPEIGRFFARDHSTVMTSVRQIEKQLDQLGPILYRITKQMN